MIESVDAAGVLIASVVTAVLLALMLGLALLGVADADQLHLLELMLANHAADVAAGTFPAAEHSFES